MSFRLSHPRPVTPPFIASRAIAASTAATRSLSVALSFCNFRQHSFLVSGSFNEPFERGDDPRDGRVRQARFFILKDLRFAETHRVVSSSRDC